MYNSILQLVQNCVVKSEQNSHYIFFKCIEKFIKNAIYVIEISQKQVSFHNYTSLSYNLSLFFKYYKTYELQRFENMFLRRHVVRLLQHDLKIW